MHLLFGYSSVLSCLYEKENSAAVRRRIAFETRERVIGAYLRVFRSWRLVLSFEHDTRLRREIGIVG